MVEQRLLEVRAGNDLEAAVFLLRRIERDPRRAGGERADRPVVAVLVERRLQAVAARLAEHLAAPQDHLLADGVGNQLDQLRVARKIEEGPAAFHALLAILEVRADQLLR